MKIRDLFIFKEPKKKEEFILQENQQEGKKQRSEKQDAKSDNTNKQAPKISKTLTDNLDRIKDKYTIPTNGDIILREFSITVKDKTINAFAVMIDGMIDRKVVDDDILQPLMILSNLDIKGEKKDLAGFIRARILPHNQLIETQDFDKLIDQVNFGGIAIFVDGIDSAFVGDVKGFEHRAVEKPNTELVIRGSMEGFNESLRTNTALIRKRLKDENIIVENIEIGERGKTPCSMLYIKNIANESLVNEVRWRLQNVKIDYLLDSGELEQLIEDSTYMPLPQMVATERPDRVAAMLAEGRVAVVVNGSPFVLVMPITGTDLIHSSEDSYVRFSYANLLRFVRILAMILSLLLPGLYLAITNFHQEMIPTDLLLAIEASREKVPFPSVIEILIMEISFELIREAGIRIPGPIGPTLGIIGALILGQAAVAANIVSPILIIIVAVTGIGSFAIPNFSLAFSFRILRFVFIILASISGLLGISTGIFVLGLWLVRAKSFGVPFIARYAPVTAGGANDQIVRLPIWKDERRPDYLNAKDRTKQQKISRKWAIRDPKGGDDSE